MQTNTWTGNKFLETVAQIGERELIRRLSPWVLGGDIEGTLGVGDDCAVIAPQPAGSRSVLTTDLLMEGTHFLHNEETDWQLVGRKAAAANLSDIAAMGAHATGILVSMGLPSTFPVTCVEQIYAGMHSLASEFNVPIVGGDTTRAPGVTIGLTVSGNKEPNRADCRRSDARPGDFLYVSGYLGASRAGLDLLLSPQYRLLFEMPQWQHFIREHYSPTPRLPLGVAMAQLYPRVAVIDISDSLSNECQLLAEASQVEIELHLDRIPLDEGLEFYCQRRELSPASFALFSGEEYELLMALPVSPDDLLEDLRHNNVDCAVTCVGTVNSGSGVSLLQDGHPVDPKDETFVHFP